MKRSVPEEDDCKRLWYKEAALRHMLRSQATNKDRFVRFNKLLATQLGPLIATLWPLRCRNPEAEFPTWSLMMTGNRDGLAWDMVDAVIQCNFNPDLNFAMLVNFVRESISDDSWLRVHRTRAAKIEIDKILRMYKA